MVDLLVCFFVSLLQESHARRNTKLLEMCESPETGPCSKEDSSREWEENVSLPVTLRCRGALGFSSAETRLSTPLAASAAALHLLQEAAHTHINVHQQQEIVEPKFKHFMNYISKILEN